MIDKLRGKEGEKRKEIVIMNADNSKILPDRIPQEMEQYWGNVYRKHKNSIEEEWNAFQREKYRRELQVEGTEEATILLNKEPKSQRIPPELMEHYATLDCKFEEKKGMVLAIFNEIEFPLQLKEHMDLVDGVIIEPKKGMNFKLWTEEQVEGVLRNIKNGKQPGPNRLKGEIYRWLGEQPTCVKAFTEAVNSVVVKGVFPESWKKSNTTMLPKKSKPKVEDHRPIALTDVNYKLVMSLLKNSIMEHLENIREINDLQAGFTRGKRMEDNVFILSYCIEESKKRRQELILMGIDFEKAFDFVDRRVLIRVMKDCKFDPLVIDMVARLYSGDSSSIYMEQKALFTTEVTCGIKQGCTLSPLLFVMIINVIIKRIMNTKLGYRNQNVYIPVLFYADDGLVLANSREEMEAMIEIITHSANECSLQISRSKSECLILNRKKHLATPEKIGEIKVVEQIKYLGILITNKREYFKQHREVKLLKARRFASMAYSVIARSCNKLMIGKTYWKCMVLPCILMAGG